MGGGEGEDNSKHFDTLFAIKEIEKWKILFSVISSFTNYVNDLEMFASALIASSTSGAFPLKCSLWLVEVDMLEWTGIFEMLNENVKSVEGCQHSVNSVSLPPIQNEELVVCHRTIKIEISFRKNKMLSRRSSAQIRFIRLHSSDPWMLAD